MEWKRYLRMFFPAYLLVAVLILALASAGSRTATVLAQNAPIPRQHRIVIDAGHGGEDGGATSCSGVLESTLNLEISLRLNDLLRLMGYETVMVRTMDTAVYTEGDTIAAKKVSDLKQRVKLVNETENSLLVSIHQNTFPQGQYSGAQVFHNDLQGSDDLAKELQSLLIEALNPGSNRKSKKSDGVYLMEHIRRPGILVECGFLSNPEEEAKLRSPDYQKRLCCVIAVAASRFLNRANSDA